ncbi:hypothetical protein BaRGS_00032750 [Batillaria attramentaria]|uniref:Uncharacterized protein n=1 Tax=Batillaria attramentaria TaxID=370345 RepID=A0ABD0JMI5_9CAEN
MSRSLQELFVVESAVVDQLYSQLLEEANTTSERPRLQKPPHLKHRQLRHYPLSNNRRTAADQLYVAQPESERDGEKVEGETVDEDARSDISAASDCSGFLPATKPAKRPFPVGAYDHNASSPRRASPPRKKHKASSGKTPSNSRRSASATQTSLSSHKRMKSADRAKKLSAGKKSTSRSSSHKKRKSVEKADKSSASKKSTSLSSHKRTKSAEKANRSSASNKSKSSPSSQKSCASKKSAKKSSKASDAGRKQAATPDARKKRPLKDRNATRDVQLGVGSEKLQVVLKDFKKLAQAKKKTSTEEMPVSRSKFGSRRHRVKKAEGVFAGSGSGSKTQSLQAKPRKSSTKDRKTSTKDRKNSTMNRKSLVLGRQKTGSSQQFSKGQTEVSDLYRKQNNSVKHRKQTVKSSGTQKRNSDVSASPRRKRGRPANKSTCADTGSKTELMSKQSAIVAHHTQLSTQASTEGRVSLFSEQDVFSQLCRLEERAKEYDTSMLQSLIPVAAQEKSEANIYRRPVIRKYSSGNASDQNTHIGGIWKSIFSEK